MLPPAVQTLIDTARSGLREWLSEDIDRSRLGDLLAEEELAAEAGRALSLGLVEEFVQERLKQRIGNAAPVGS